MTYSSGLFANVCLCRRQDVLRMFRQDKNVLWIQHEIARYMLYDCNDRVPLQHDVKNLILQTQTHTIWQLSSFILGGLGESNYSTAGSLVVNASDVHKTLRLLQTHLYCHAACKSLRVPHPTREVCYLSYSQQKPALGNLP